MMNKYLLNIVAVLFASLVLSNLSAQTLPVLPYLQDATPSSIRIMWESSFGTESTVEWGLDENLGNTVTGISFPGMGGSVMHDVQITGLERFTTYYYLVTTGAATSATHKFKTPPFSSDNEDFRFVAMSDMQRSYADPQIYDEIIHDGILDYLMENASGDPSNDLALVLIPGDLVDHGNTYSQWSDQFFEQSEELFSDVPVYPVLGNHEVNTPYYFQYFHLPNNGTAGYEEHWWYKDYGNVRFIGLDSNGPYNGEEQLVWLDEVLSNTCSYDSIDFVFAELHHPHKSELWTPGESGFTGEVIQRLENFTEGCGKPSIHFFGHTHGYSRGQSRDFKHSWINVATAGGAIDYWGEWPQFDYDEFQVTEDDWGFVMVDVEAGDNPKFTVSRLSRGDGNTSLDNIETDRFTITKAHLEVNTPTPLYPIEIDIAPECVILHGSSFSGVGEHGETHWQVSEQVGFGDTVAEVWERFENIYFNEDTQAGESITKEEIGGLPENANLFWRVRYRDKQLNWSGWSEVVSFTTTSTSTGENLLINPGSESELNNWIIDEGVCESQLAGDCAGTNPYAGVRYFAVGGLCDESPVGRMHQDVDVSGFSEEIITGEFVVNFGAMMSDWSGSDIPDMRVQFVSSTNNIIGGSEYFAGNISTWTSISETMNIPSETQVIRCELRGTRNAGVDNDSYFDDVFIKVSEEVACPQFSTCNEDIVVNGVIDIFDILAVLSQYGCLANCISGDVNLDGAVTQADILAVLAIFGQEC